MKQIARFRKEIFEFFAKYRKEKIEIFISLHLDSDFSLVAILFKLFRQVLKPCRHLMLNPFWDPTE